MWAPSEPSQHSRDHSVFAEHCYQLVRALVPLCAGYRLLERSAVLQERLPADACELLVFLHLIDIGAGFDHEDEKSAAGPTQTNKGFIQTTEFIDVLGPINFDSAFRFDFSSVADTQFSALLGLQVVEGLFTFSGDYAKGVLEFPQEDLQQVDLGFHSSHRVNGKPG